MNEEVTRPWGTYRILETGENFQIKLLTINPKSRLSDQRHKYRGETWIPVDGILKVDLQGHVTPIPPGRSLSIERMAWHRLENQSNNPIQVIEIQYGTNFDENDTKRRADDYGRVD